MLVANILFSQIYAAHPMVVAIQNSWNPDLKLTLFLPKNVRIDIVLLVHSWPTPKKC